MDICEGRIETEAAAHYSFENMFDEKSNGPSAVGAIMNSDGKLQVSY